MRHPTEGVLRRLLDEPAAVSDADRDHVSACEPCLGELVAIRGDADAVHAALASASTVDVAVTGEPRVHAVAGPAEAAAESGLAVPEVVRLPRGVFGQPTYQVGGQVSATFTFSADRASRAAASTRQALPALPPGLDGSKV